jgi:hypothetical protein
MPACHLLAVFSKQWSMIGLMRCSEYESQQREHTARIITTVWNHEVRPLRLASVSKRTALSSSQGVLLTTSSSWFALETNRKAWVFHSINVQQATVITLCNYSFKDKMLDSCLKLFLFVIDRIKKVISRICSKCKPCAFSSKFHNHYKWRKKKEILCS